MEVKTCVLCRRLYNSIIEGDEICPNCRKIKDEDLSKIKKYLLLNPNSNIKELSTQLNIPSSRIFYYLKIGIIEIIGETKIKKCQKCKKPIKNNEEYCADCKKILVNELQKSMSKEPSIEKNTNAKMRFLKK